MWPRHVSDVCNFGQFVRALTKNSFYNFSGEGRKEKRHIAIGTSANICKHHTAHRQQKANSSGGFGGTLNPRPYPSFIASISLLHLSTLRPNSNRIGLCQRRARKCVRRTRDVRPCIVLSLIYEYVQMATRTWRTSARWLSLKTGGK